MKIPPDGLDNAPPCCLRYHVLDNDGVPRPLRAAVANRIWACWATSRCCGNHKAHEIVGNMSESRTFYLALWTVQHAVARSEELGQTENVWESG